MTDDKIAAIRERLDNSKTLNTHWRAVDVYDGDEWEVRDHGVGIYRVLAGGISNRGRAEFLAHAPEDIGALLEERSRLAEVERRYKVIRSEYEGILRRLEHERDEARAEVARLTLAPETVALLRSIANPASNRQPGCEYRFDWCTAGCPNLPEEG